MILTKFQAKAKVEVLVMCRLRLGLKHRLWPGFRRLELEEIVSRAQSQKSDLALAQAGAFDLYVQFHNFGL